ncbi:hypothetical protein DFH06DRAFT_1337463 [Mycena polygramma]|nr:hypothetical protein DFH06DRAFT_1337463 [Mycena polygramma]
MSPQWVSTDRFRQPKPNPKYQTKELGVWSVSAFLACVTILLFGWYLGSKIYAGGKIFPIQSGELFSAWYRWSNLPHRQIGLGDKCNYADVTMDARVEMDFTSHSYTMKNTFFASLFGPGPETLAAELVFRSRHEGDGRCWEISGSTGTIAVRLSQTLAPAAIAVHQSIQHQLSSRTVMAPRQLTIWAIDGGTTEGQPHANREHKPIDDFLVSGRSVPKDLQGQKVVNIMDFEFAKNSGVSSQVFLVPSSPRTNLIIVEVRDNWGGNRTCIQRIGVY